MSKKTTGSGPGGPNRGSCADADWMERMERALGKGYGDNVALRKAIKIGKESASKLKKHGSGSADVVFRASRFAGVAPPRHLLDEWQYRLLDGLERVRRAIPDADDKTRKALAEELVVRFEAMVAERTRPQEPPAPLGRGAVS